MLYLIQHCGDKVKPLIEFCLLLEPSRSIVKAKEVLHESFGRKSVRAYVKRLIEGQNIKHDNSKDLISFSREIEECLVSLTHLKYFSDLNSFENISKIVRKLPYGLQSRWLRFASKIEKQDREPTFTD